jgi:hypothetical protein
MVRVTLAVNPGLPSSTSSLSPGCRVSSGSRYPRLGEVACGEVSLVTVIPPLSPKNFNVTLRCVYSV